MKLLKGLFSTDYGLMSIIGTTFMPCMGAFFVRLFIVKMNERPAPQVSSGRLPGSAGPRAPSQ